MKIQCKTVFTSGFFTSFLFKTHLQLKQLALPKQDLAIVSEHKITFNEFVSPYSDYLFSSSIKDNIIKCCSILNNMICGYLLLDNVTLLNITKIGFLNNQSHLPGVLKREKFFISTN